MPSQAAWGSGGAGGNGNTVNVVNNGAIETSGDRSRAIFAQSIGGGGGTGGHGNTGLEIPAPIPDSVLLKKNTAKSKSFEVTVGGDGGSGNHGSAVNVQPLGNITASNLRGIHPDRRSWNSPA